MSTRPRVRTVQEMTDRLHPSPELLALRGENQELKNKLQAAAREIGNLSEITTAIQTAARIAAPPVFRYAPPRGVLAVETPCALVVHLTDLHIGLKVDGPSVEEFNRFDYQIAVARMEALTESILKWVRVNRAAYKIPHCRILGTSDWISGDIHEGLVRTNEFPAPVQAVKAGYLVGEFCASLAQDFETVTLEFVAPGNHDRLTRKPQMQAGGYNSWGYVVGEIVRQYLSRRKNVTVNVYPQFETVVDVLGWRYLIGHGAGILGTWGIPYYGIERRKQREAMARMNMPEDKRFHKIVIGHFHSALNHEHWEIGGSLSGTDENDHSQGRHSAAHQTAWLLHPKHGEFGWTRFWL